MALVAPVHIKRIPNEGDLWNTDFGEVTRLPIQYDSGVLVRFEMDPNASTTFLRQYTT
jgi:hypothetical protein